MQTHTTRVGGISHILRGTFGELFDDSNINNVAVASTESLDEIQTVSCVNFDFFTTYQNIVTNLLYINHFFSSLFLYFINSIRLI